MFPGDTSDTHPDSYNAPTSIAPTSSSSSPIISGGTSISAETTSSLYLHQHPHLHHQFPPHQLQDKQQQSLHNLQQQWPLASYYPPSDMAARDTERLLADQGLLRQQYLQQQAGNMTREEAQMLLQHSVGANMQLQGISMMPGPVEQFYNEQLLRSLSSRAAGSQYSGIEPRSIYGSLQTNQELQMANQSSSSHVLNRTLENIGRSADAAAGVRYEETCTPRPRWCPTQEQIQILESLFNSGTTTPSRDMIVDIAAQLRKYGTIAEANVFYWFQNRKARAKRKLQPPAPAPAPPLHQPCVSAASDPDHATSESTHIVSATAPAGSGAAAGFEHAAQSKSRRVSLKHTSASSPSSSTSPDPHHVTGAGPASPSPLQQQPIKPLLHQDTLLVPNRAGAGTAGNPIQINQPSLYSWSQQHLERLPPEEGQEAPAPIPSYPQYLLRSHGENPAETSHPEAFHHLLEYPRISLSLAPPTQHHSLHSSQVLGRTRVAGGVLGYNTQSDHQFLQATSKGIMLMDPQDSLGGGAMIAGGSSCTSSTISSAFLSQLGASRHLAEIEGSQFSQVQSGQLPQSSLPLARPGDQPVAEREQEQLQMWEDLDSCNTLGPPWNAGQSHH